MLDDDEPAPVPHRKLQPGKIVIASHNEGKVREIRALLEPYGIEPVSAGSLGIPEPVDTNASLAPDAMDVVLVPLLGFDRRGHRLGFGGGYYDRSFAFLRDLERPSKPLLVGIGYALQEIDRIEPEDWDVRLDYVATERELIDCINAEG